MLYFVQVFHSGVSADVSTPPLLLKDIFNDPEEVGSCGGINAPFEAAKSELAI